LLFNNYHHQCFYHRKFSFSIHISIKYLFFFIIVKPSKKLLEPFRINFILILFLQLLQSMNIDYLYLNIYCFFSVEKRRKKKNRRKANANNFKIKNKQSSFNYL
jgi:hypothetical protein